MIDANYVRRILRTHAGDAGSWLKLAAWIGISPQYLNDIKFGRREPGRKVLKFLRLRKVVGYEVVKR
jgi:hypothetical protein